MIRYRVLAIASAGAALLAGCGTLKTKTDVLDLLKRCTSKQGPLDGYCGTVEVWENREAQTGRRINLKVVVLPGARRAENRDPLFFLAGGPGQSATREASGIQQMFRPVLADRDIVLVDQRGTGESNSLACEPKEGEPLGADLEALFPENGFAVADDEFHAAAANIYDQVFFIPHFYRAAHSQVDQFRFPIAGNNFHLNAEFAVNVGGQLRVILFLDV